VHKVHVGGHSGQHADMIDQITTTTTGQQPPP
jgi:hypothetical protein